jgi:23S rRNA pseudouridine2457 synthase
MLSYFVFYKPFNVLSQFSSAEGKPTLQHFCPVEKDVYPVGRLDADSEGLLILTNDTTINKKLLDPAFKHEREYWVQVEGNINNDALAALSKGVAISIDGKSYKTLPAKASAFVIPPDVPERNPPIRFRKTVPDSWLRLILMEGKNRQVRKMTAQVGFPTLRLIRYRIEKLTLAGLQPGEMKSYSQGEMYNLLNLKK